MNKGQLNLDMLVKLGLLIFVVLPLLSTILSAITLQNCPKCETCNYSPYISQVSECKDSITRLQNQINQTPIKYIQNITYVNITSPCNSQTPSNEPVPITITVISGIFSLFVTINLFKLKIKLPKELEQELSHIGKWIKVTKWCSLIVSILILGRLIWIFFSLI